MYEVSHNQLVQKILKTKIVDEAMDVYNELIDKHDETNSALKLISYILKEESKNKIGPNQQEINRLQEQENKPKNEDRGFRNSNRRDFGSRNNSSRGFSRSGGYSSKERK